MQSARTLLSGGHHSNSGESAEALRGHGDWHGRGNIDEAKREAAFTRGLFAKYLNVFPKNMRVAAGTATMVAAGVGIYAFFKPQPTATKKTPRTLSPEWQKDTEQLLKEQRISVAHKKTG